MGFIARCIAATAVVVSTAHVTPGQSSDTPSLLPSMVSAERYIAEEISDPWYPPDAQSELSIFSAPAPAITPLPPIEAAAPAVRPEELPLPADMAAPAIAEQLLPNGIIDELPSAWYRPAQWFGPMAWDTGIELGLNGSSGTNEALSVRTGGYIQRESRFSKLDLSGYYNKTTTRGETTQNNATVDARNDWLLDDTSPWTLYGTGNLFYDEFQAFDAQVSANSGVGYRFVYDPKVNLIGRFGAGSSREIGGPDDRWVPESLVGFEYSQRLSVTQKFYSKLDYFPEWDQFGEFRVVADIGWEVELLDPSKLSLKIAAGDRYDSTPNGAEPHLLNYSVLLLLKL
jgi:Protein of unknown function, DUF481